ncbi:MAG: hypothetical protein A2020_13830 [Lentisphaerae bacterium GWF2_45_14]|nr:MAG: hypothetical protein A2020_13830 [Lentisphaerae bacterium GWF2_45_14]
MRRLATNFLSICAVTFLAGLVYAQDDSNRPSIGLITRGQESFWRTFSEGVDAGARDLNYNIKRPAIINQDTNALQTKTVLEMVNLKVTAIIVSPLDDRTLVRPLKDAESKGIKIILANSKLKLSTYLSYVTVDNYNLGKLCAKKMSQLLGGKGKVVVIPLAADNDTTLQREKGFTDELKESAPGIKIFISSQYSGSTYQQAAHETANILAQYSFADGFFCSEEITTQCMVNVLSTRKTTGPKKIVGYGINQELLNALKNGKVDALAISNPYELGYESIKLIDMSLKGKKVKNRIEFPAFIADKESLKKEKIKQLIIRQLPDAFKTVTPTPAPVVKPAAPAIPLKTPPKTSTSATKEAGKVRLAPKRIFPSKNIQSTQDEYYAQIMNPA